MLKPQFFNLFKIRIVSNPFLVQCCPPANPLLLLFGNFQRGSSLQKLVLLRLPFKCQNIKSLKTYFAHQVFVELFKVASDDWYRERHDKHSTDGTHAAHKLESKRLKDIISISFEVFVQRCLRFPMLPCQGGSLERYHRSQQLSS